MKIAILALALALLVACCPTAQPSSCPPPSQGGSDGWCEVQSSCPPSSPHAFRLCGTGEKSAPIPSRCGGGGALVTSADGAVCCP